MSEWWTYRPSDLLLFSARTYHRLFELYNADVWPAHLLAIGLGLALCVALWQGRPWAPRAACALLAAAWLWVAWAFHWHRYASINWAATWFAAAFAVEGVLLLCWAVFDANAPSASRRGGRARSPALLLLAFALAVQPMIGTLLGRPWRQVEVLGLAPDPTVLGTLGLLLLVRPGNLNGAAPDGGVGPAVASPLAVVRHHRRDTGHDGVGRRLAVAWCRVAGDGNGRTCRPRQLT
jgi:Family of unknown function (DUF6064)